MSVITIKKQVKMLKQILLPKPEDKVVVRMWMPPDDPRHDMTDAELERLNPLNKIVVKPLIIIRALTEEEHEQFEESEKP